MTTISLRKIESDIYNLFEKYFTQQNEIQNKDDLLYSLWSMYDNFDSDASAPELRKELLEKFIKHIEAMKLPRRDDWWFYSYNFTRFGIELDMCHCEEIVFESKDIYTMTVDETLTTDYTDTESQSEWAKPYVSALTSTSILKGYEDGSFKPTNNLRRDETMIVIYRILNIGG